MICILGKTASGKSEIVKKMVEEHSFKKILTYTTRPMRRGEKDGVDYHFISDKDFNEKISNNFFAEWKTYDSAYGLWYYGTAMSDILKSNKRSVLIVTPQGYRDLVDILGFRPRSIYICANQNTIETRLKSRKQKAEEKKRRIQKDNEDFKDVYNLVDKIVYNNLDDELNVVVDKVIKYGLEA